MLYLNELFIRGVQKKIAFPLLKNYQGLKILRILNWDIRRKG